MRNRKQRYWDLAGRCFCVPPRFSDSRGVLLFPHMKRCVTQPFLTLARWGTRQIGVCVSASWLCSFQLGQTRQILALKRMAKFTQFCILDLAKPYGLFDTFLSSLLNQFPESIFTARTHCSVGGVEERRLFRAADFPRAFLPRASSCRSCRLSLPKGPAPSSRLHSLSTAPCPSTVFFSLFFTLSLSEPSSWSWSGIASAIGECGWRWKGGVEAPGGPRVSFS